MNSDQIPTLVAPAARYGTRPALVTPDGPTSYLQLLDASARVAATLLDGRDDLSGARVAFLAGPGALWVALQWGIWRAGGTAVPLATSHPPAELEHVITDADPDRVVAGPEFADTLRALAGTLGCRFNTTAEVLGAGMPGPTLPVVARDRPALIVYTSGTSGRPKGAVHTHASLEAQVTSLVSAWEWTPEDRSLLVLPLHHVHGIVNVLACTLWSGATCEVHARFDALRTWESLATGRLTVFMAVPTIYRRLITAWNEAGANTRKRWSEGARSARLMVSGSAALPVTTFERWREISGHDLLERYGMTEIGMALSNPLHGGRRPGHVGVPLPGVEVRLVDEQGGEAPAGSPGEIEVRGPTLFREYWRQPAETEAAFRNGWFRTGDTAILDDGSYRILGRSSIDIIKTGGYKVSALEIETVLRDHPGVADCAVIGVEDAEWGERICAAIEPAPAGTLDVTEFAAWVRERLAPYKVPKQIVLLAAMPRNAMGKVIKRALTGAFTG